MAAVAAVAVEVAVAVAVESSRTDATANAHQKTRRASRKLQADRREVSLVPHHAPKK